LDLEVMRDEGTGDGEMRQARQLREPFKLPNGRDAPGVSQVAENKRRRDYLGKGAKGNSLWGVFP
jgi:hypothetical protein